MEVEANDDYDFIPGTPPHKKVILVYMLFLVNLAILQTTNYQRALDWDYCSRFVFVAADSPYIGSCLNPALQRQRPL